MWNSLIGGLSDKLPDFNQYLLKEFREEKINEIPDYLDALFRQSIVILDNHLTDDKPRLEYVGYKELTPEERIEFMKRKATFGKKFEIQESKFKIMKFEFRFQDEIFPMYVDIPYMDNYAVTISGIEYYPLFAVVEKGGMYRLDDEVILQVMRAKLKFWRNDKEAVSSIENRTWKDVNITTKLHQKSGGKRKRPPILIYHLVKNGFLGTMKLYKVDKHISLVEEPVPDDKYQHIKIKDGAYIRVTVKGMNEDQYVRRVVISLMVIYRFWKKIDQLKDLFGTTFYKVALGKWTYPSVTNVQLLYNNATNHINMNESMLDPTAQHQHRSIGIDCKDLDDLLLHAFFNIDKWLADYQGNNLYNKKIGTLEQMMAGLVRTFNNKLFKGLVNNKVGLTKESVKSLMHATNRNKWIKNSTMFRGKPIVYNDNYLLAIGAKRFRSTDNTETSSDKGGQNSLPASLLRAHPSSMVVESALCFPSSSPVVTGTINPFVNVDPDGNIHEPEWSHEIADVYDG
jgi:hypothetical protein